MSARTSFANSRLQFETKKTGHVAFIGGSITEMNGYRPLVCEFLTKRFPGTEFTFTSAGVSSTCSSTGAFRLASDVLAKGPVDLFFIEFAVNDDQDAGHARRECIRGMEGIIRQALKHNANMDIVITYFVNPSMLKTLQAGKVPLTIASHEEVARHYGVSTVNLAKEVAHQIKAGTLTWDQYGGVHPAPRGNQLCASLIIEMLNKAWHEALPAGASPATHPLPDALDPGNYGNGRFIEIKKARSANGWSIYTPDWKKLPGSFRETFRALPLLCGTTPGADLTLEFDGTAVGAYLLAGPDAGMVETSIDEGPFAKSDLYHRFSKGLHYPRTVMFATDLKPGPHKMVLRILPEKNQDSTGNAVRIIQFVAN